MIIVEITAGLGNQMFQYAYAKALESKKYNVKIDISGLKTHSSLISNQLKNYKINLPIATKQEIKKFYKKNIFSKILNKLSILNNRHIKEKRFSFDKDLLYPINNNYIRGYFQSEKYFIEIRRELLDDFSIKNGSSQYSIEMKNKIIKTENSCSIHIRRGDYLSNPRANKVHGVCELDYYKKSITLMNNKFNNNNYFIFSDDIKWAKENFKIKNIIFVDSQEERIPNEDIYLMSLCQNNIIANSSFSWWGAWLNKNDNKTVIAPKKWLVNEADNKMSDDLIPKKWIRL